MYKFYYAIALFLMLLNIELSSEEKSLEKQIDFQTSKFKYILETALKYHPDSVDIEQVSDAAFNSLLQAFDKESFYYNKTVYKRVQESNRGISYGIGAEIVSLLDTLFVIQVFPNTPAFEAGIEIGDVISMIDGKTAYGLSKMDADKLIQGDSATKVELTLIKVYDNQTKKVTITRRDISQPGITTSYIFPGTDIGVIVMNRFSETSSLEFRLKSEQLLKLGVKKLLIDLRGNPGGYITKVDEILDYLIAGNKLLTRTVSGAPDLNQQIYSKDGDFLEKIPLVVLIDENSASGSELLAGVVQDYDRGIVVGKRSYGKGSIQQIWHLNDSTGFKLTIGKYLTPSGRDIQKYPNEENIQIDAGLDANFNTEEISKKIKEMGGMNIPKIFKSEKGRPIIAGGGVIPDFIVDKDTLTQLTNLLIRRGLFFRWSIEFKKKEGRNLLNKFGSNYTKFNFDFNITDDQLRDFANYALANKVWNNDMFTVDKSYFINYQKASIANVIWGYDAFSEVLCIVDNQLVAAVKQMINAENMLKN